MALDRWTLPCARQKQAMNEPDNIWPPPPKILSPRKGAFKGYTWLKSVAWVLLCYAICLILLYLMDLYSHPDIWKHSENLSFWIERFFPFWFAIHMLILICLHLPLIMLLQRRLGTKNVNWLALASASWGSILAVGMWCLYNYLLGGYDPACDPYTGLINWGCGISTISIVPLVLAGSVTGYIAGHLFMRQKAQQPAV